MAPRPTGRPPVGDLDRPTDDSFLPGLLLGCRVDALVDLGDPFNPQLALAMLQCKHLVTRPMKVVGDIGYLLVEPVERVANYPPKVLASTSK